MFPPHRKPFHQDIQPQSRRLPPIDDRLDNVRRQQRQPQHAADVCLGDFSGRVIRDDLRAQRIGAVTAVKREIPNLMPNIGQFHDEIRAFMRF